MNEPMPDDAISLKKMNEKRFTLWCNAVRCVWNTDDDPSGDTCSCTKDQVHLMESGPHLGVGCLDLEEGNVR